jgi:hypothetical protein
MGSRMDAMGSRMDAMGSRLDTMDTRMDSMGSRMDSMDTRMGAMEHRLKEHMDGRIDASEARMKDYIRQADFELETKLIGEFWKWGRSSDVRVREVQVDGAAVTAKAQLISERLMNVEDRVSALERQRGAA